MYMYQVSWILMLKRHSLIFKFMILTSPTERRKLLINICTHLARRGLFLWQNNMEIIVFTGWARGEVLLLNNFLPSDIQKPRKVFLMPYTDISEGITHTIYFRSYNSWGLLCARCCTNRQSVPWRSYQLRACWNRWNSQHSYSRLIVLL